MKVKCVRLLDEQSGKSIKESSWLSVGSVYHVLSIHLGMSGRIKFQLIGDDGSTPAFHDCEQFELVCGRVPSEWVVEFVKDSHFELIPKAWTQAGFWEQYFDGDREALLLFENERNKILAED